MTNHAYLHGQLENDIKHIKSKVDVICDQPEICKRRFITRWQAYVVMGIIAGALVGLGILNLETLASFIP